MNQTDLNTAIEILNQQMGQLQSVVNMLAVQCANMKSIITDPDPAYETNPQIHALTASMDYTMQSQVAANAVVRQWIDKVAELSA